jgi:hypothetical protein
VKRLVIPAVLVALAIAGCGASTVTVTGTSPVAVTSTKPTSAKRPAPAIKGSGHYVPEHGRVLEHTQEGMARDADIERREWLESSDGKRAAALAAIAKAAEAAEPEENPGIATAAALTRACLQKEGFYVNPTGAIDSKCEKKSASEEVEVEEYKDAMSAPHSVREPKEEG